MEPRIQYVRTADGVLVACAVSGEGAPLLSIPGPPDNHVELEWRTPGRRESIEALSRHRMLVRFDPRGSGLSDRDPGTYSLEERLRDVDAVVARLNLSSFDLVAGEHGAQLAVAYAVRHPDQVRSMVLVGPVVRGQDFIPPQQRAIMGQVLRQDYAMFTEMVGAMVFGWGRQEGPRYSVYFRQCVNQADAITIYDAMDRVDVTDLLDQVTCPVLVIDQSTVTARGSGRRLASLVPQATYVPVAGGPVEGVNPEILRLMGEFFGEDWTEHLAGHEQGVGAPLGVILFTDIEGHSMLVDRLGDRAARQVLREYEAITRRAIRASGGTEVKALGDGFMAWFSSASGAVACAVALQREYAAEGTRGGTPLRVRVGLNAGEPVAEANDLFGTAVIVAARAAASAAGGEIVVTDVVRQLVAGKQYLFADRGQTPLKGFEDPVRTWLLHW